MTVLTSINERKVTGQQSNCHKLQEKLQDSKVIVTSRFYGDIVPLLKEKRTNLKTATSILVHKILRLQSRCEIKSWYRFQQCRIYYNTVPFDGVRSPEVGGRSGTIDGVILYFSLSNIDLSLLFHYQFPTLVDCHLFLRTMLFRPEKLNIHQKLEQNCAFVWKPESAKDSTPCKFSPVL